MLLKKLVKVFQKYGDFLSIGDDMKKVLKSDLKLAMELLKILYECKIHNFKIDANGNIICTEKIDRNYVPSINNLTEYIRK